MNREPIPLPPRPPGPTNKRRQRLSTSGEPTDLAHVLKAVRAGGRHVEDLVTSGGFRIVEFRAGPGLIARLRQMLKEHKNCELCRNAKLAQLD